MIALVACGALGACAHAEQAKVGADTKDTRARTKLSDSKFAKRGSPWSRYVKVYHFYGTVNETPYQPRDSNAQASAKTEAATEDGTR